MIELENLTKSYGEHTVVDAVTTQIPAGGITSIIGPNGAGKSTLLSMMGRLLPADAGHCRIDGQDVFTTDSKLIAQKMAILRQENVLTVRLTVRDLVGFGRFPHHQGRPTEQDRVKVEQALDYLDLLPFADKFVDELSGGQRQRAFISMVLAQDTDYLFLDEPLNNLDMRHSVQMMRLLAQLSQELAKTVVIVIHDINFASCYSDQILAMKDGRLIDQGTPEEMMSTPRLRAIYDIDIPVEVINDQRIGIYYR